MLLIEVFQANSQPVNHGGRFFEDYGPLQSPFPSLLSPLSRVSQCQFAQIQLWVREMQWAPNGSLMHFNSKIWHMMTKVTLMLVRNYWLKRLWSIHNIHINSFAQSHKFIFLQLLYELFQQVALREQCSAACQNCVFHTTTKLQVTLAL